MSSLPRVTELTRERIARQFDDLGPDACMAEILQELRSDNPEILEMARKSAVDIGNEPKTMMGFGMFYQLLVAESCPNKGKQDLSLLPRVTPETREKIVQEIDEDGAEAFTLRSIEDLQNTNPELMQMAHHFASRYEDYLRVMQGFGLLYRSLILQATADRSRLH